MPPGIRKLETTIAYRELLHFLEYPEGHKPPERIERLAREVLPEARSLAEPAGCFVSLPSGQAPAVGLEIIEAEGLVIGLVTAGAAIEARAKELIDAGELTRGLMMDAAGSAAAEEAADRLSEIIVLGGDAKRDSEAKRQGRLADRAAGGDEPIQGEERKSTACRLSPGYGRWEIRWQPALFERLPHEALAVELSPSFMMLPRKSISFALWLGAAGPIGKGVVGCSACGLRHCRYRRHPRS